MEDLISIIIPVYNVEKYLKRAVESVINQTYNNLEIILVDDGSTDKSGKLCDEIAYTDSRIIVIHQENQGLSGARNTGIKKAKGKYIGFVDSDDVISRQMYEYMHKAIIETNSQISICKYTRFEQKTPVFDLDYKVETLDNDEIIKQLMIGKKISDHSWNKLYDKTLFTNIEFPLNRKFEDIGTTFKTFLKANKTAYINMTLYGYFYRNDSIINCFNKKRLIDYIEMYRYRNNILIEEKANLTNYINMNRVNLSTICFLDIAMYRKKELLKDEEIKKILYDELKYAKKLNTKEVKKINTKKLNLLNNILFFNTYIFYFIMNIYYKLKRIRDKEI